MIHWIQKLPHELVRECILPYTYQPQSPELCMDIQSYHTVLQHLSQIYKTTYIAYKNEDKEWLLYDIILYMNNHKSLLYGYEDCYIEWFRRLYMLKDAHRDQIIQMLKTPSWYFTRKINCHIALMKPKEREDLKSFLIAVYDPSFVRESRI